MEPRSERPADRNGTRWLVLGRVLARRCPQCGRGRLFRAYGRLHATCSECGLLFRREAGAQTGSMYLTAVLTEVFAAAVIVFLWWRFDWTTAWFITVAVPAVLAFCAFSLPLAQALWVGIDYVTDLEGHEPWARLQR
jgi:uncharacterized protein (DUF983 family)